MDDLDEQMDLSLNGLFLKRVQNIPGEREGEKEGTANSSSLPGSYRARHTGASRLQGKNFEQGSLQNANDLK